ncbi:hypothetical protein [Confluentibacter citreus]|uniref:hypothetical protein n=1 Tax=Confluentibacter citreus TaxID=2007307 RepID=UPI000C2883CC|nr:hypothetical protein [Confluentibacter citreus]
MKVKPGIGINDIKFGMSENQILSLIGKPSKIIIDEDDEDKNQVYQYNELKLRLTFYNEFNGKLGYIRVANPKIEINGNPIIGIQIEDVFKSYGLSKENWNEEKYFTFNSYFNEKKWTTLNVEYDVVTDIEFGYLFDKSGENPIWPK